MLELVDINGTWDLGPWEHGSYYNVVLFLLVGVFGRICHQHFEFSSLLACNVQGGIRTHKKALN